MFGNYFIPKMKRCAVILVLCAVACFAADPKEIKEFEDILNAGIQNYFNTGNFSNNFLKLAKKMDLVKLNSDNPQAYIDPQLLCSGCEIVFDAMINEYRNGTAPETLSEYAKDLCKTLKIQADHICDGLIDLNIHTLLYMAGKKTELNGAVGCPIILQAFGCQSTEDSASWKVKLHDGQQPRKRNANGKPFKILQITDIHYDPIYEEGTNAKCDHPLCCQYDSGDVRSPEDAAGYWTDYRSCDIPLRTLDASLDHIAAEHKDIDYVYFTGDIISHRVWATDIKNNTKDIVIVLDRFENTFGKIPVFPIVGNHEPHPLNVWAPEDIKEPEISTQWLFDLVAEEWSRWLPADTKETILIGGYYTVLVRPGFRVIALNSNVAYTFNWWLMYEDVDPYGQLAWMEKVLNTAEQNGESVHIISHVPSGDVTCYIPWANNFRNIVERYSNSITGIFNGHSHHDELIVYHKLDDKSTAVSVAWNGGSLTPYSDFNPNYRIYSVDSANLDIIDFDQYTFNLTEANLNKNKPPTWYHLYSFKKEYGVDDLSPASISNLTARMAKDHSLLEQYFRNKVREADPSMEKGCDEKCHKANLCAMVISSYDDHSKCDELMEQWN